MKKRLFAAWIALLIALAPLPIDRGTKAEENPKTDWEQMEKAGETYLSSGLFSEAKLTKDEIRTLLKNNPIDMPSAENEIFDQVPHCSNPFSAGKVKRALLEQTLGRLNALRKIAGLKSVELDDAYCNETQYGAVLLASSEFSHTPSKPSGMSDDFYQIAYGATSSSNIAAGTPLTGTPDAFMDDSDAGNVKAVGHRRWQLNPKMAKTGFGYALNSNSPYKRFTCEKSFDQSASVGDYDFVSWPSSGNFPNDMQAFNGSTAWSISLNEQKYSAPVLSDLTLTLTRQSDMKKWVFSGKESYAPSNDGKYFNVITDGYGIRYCIIFRPDNITEYDGVYTVKIEGLKDKNGKSVDFAYQVDFFSSVEKIEFPGKDLNYTGQNIKFYTYSEYPFYNDTVNGRTVAVSGNKGVHSSVSVLGMKLSLKAGDQIKFDYWYSTEQDHDMYVLSVNGSDIQMISGSSNGWRGMTFTTGSDGVLDLTWSYKKDASNSSGEDRVMIDNVRIVRNGRLLGDANGDGYVRLDDAILTLRIALGLNATDNLKAIDINCDGNLTTVDAICILRMVMGI